MEAVQQPSTGKSQETHLRVTRLTKSSHVLQFVNFFWTGMNVIQKKTGEAYDKEVLLPQILFFATHKEHGYVAVVRDDHNNPLGFIVGQDATQLYDKDKSAIIKAVFHAAGRKDVGRLLIRHFEQWLKDNDYKRYIVTTRRSVGPAARYFKTNYGLERSYTVFQKDL